MTIEGVAPEIHRAAAVGCFNRVWELIETPDRTADQDVEMVHTAHASVFHWSVIGTPVNAVRGEWQCSRVYAVLGRGEPALHHGRRAVALCEQHAIGDWDLAYAKEALARAYAVSGDSDAAREWLGAARCCPIVDDESRDMVLADLDQLAELL